MSISDQRGTPMSNYKSIDNNSKKTTNATVDDAQSKGDQCSATKEESKTGAANSKKDKTYSNWFGRKNLPGVGLFYKFTNFENRLIRWVLEK